jgi:protein-L-isoaspartate O-methyltransferase
MFPVRFPESPECDRGHIDGGGAGMREDGTVIEDIVAQLSCPHCATALGRRGNALVCEEGHAFDIARHGYVTLFGGDVHRGTADTPAMVEARARFLGEGHYAGIAELVVRLAAEAPAPDGTCVVDLGAGTGYYLAAVLDAVDAAGIALDVSKPAARFAARAHPRVGAVVADAWQPLPVRGRAASVVLNVFAPRNPREMARILHPDGRAVVVVPEPDHLRELVEKRGLLSVDERKTERLEAQFAERFVVEAEHGYRAELDLSGEQVAALIGMGPNAWHEAARGAGGTAEGGTAEGGTAGVTEHVTLSVRALVLTRR